MIDLVHPTAHTRVGTSTARLAGLLLFLLAAQFMTVIMLAASMAGGPAQLPPHPKIAPARCGV